MDIILSMTIIFWREPKCFKLDLKSTTIIKHVKQSHLDEGIGLQTFGVLHSDLQSIGCGAEDGMVFEGDGFQYVGQIASIVQTCH